MKILVIIPAYNEEKNIINVVNKIEELDIDVDYLVINDCSTDGTLDVLRNNRMHYLSLPVNLGIGGGVQTGYRYAVEHDYDIAIQHDGDGQHDPKYFNDVIEPILSGEADIVIGSRFIEKQGFQSSALRRFGISFLSKLIQRVCGVKIKDVTSGYRAVNKKYISFYAKDYPSDYPEPEAIVSASLRGAKIKEVPVIMNERQNGVSSINYSKSIYYMIKVSISIIICRLSYRRKARV